VFSFTVCTLGSDILTPSAWNWSWCVSFNFKLYRITWTLLMAYYKAKLKSNDVKASPCFKHFLIGNT